MTAVSVVGIGADGWHGLSETSRAAVNAAEVIFGSSRQLDLMPASSAGVRVVWPSPLLPALSALLAEHAGRRRCVLASGDPMFFGIGSALVELLGVDGVRVLPAVSSVSLACGRLGWRVETTEVLSLVGRPAAALTRLLAPGRRVLILSAGVESPSLVAELLREGGYGASAMSVLSDLGSDREAVVRATAQSWTGTASSLNIVAVECTADGGPGFVGSAFVGLSAAGLGSTGLPDEAFEHDGQLTKRDVRAITLARLAPAYGQRLWDIGAGSGSVSIEWLRGGRDCYAVAIERDAERAARIERNAVRLGVPQLEVITGAAPAALSGLPVPDAIFVGGGLTGPGLLDQCWDALAAGGRLVANAVTLESEAVLLEAYADLGGELTRLSVSSAAPVGSFTGWRTAMPVTQWSVVKT